jgi:hypothetical protein
LDELGRLTGGARARPVQRESQIMALMLTVGADIPQISRLTGIPMETVRYHYREHFLKRRMRVQRELIHDKLGLQHIQFIVTADPDLEPLFYNSALLSGVWEEIYVNTVYRIIPEDQFFLDHLVPSSFVPRLRDFYRELEDLGALRVLETYDCTRLTHLRMWVEDYNWEMQGWDFDWSPSSLKPPRNIEDPPASQQVKFDKTDLWILRELHYRYDRKMTEIAAKHSTDHYSASWHFRRHVEARGLLGEYRINWLGTGRETETGSAPKQHQSFVGMNFIAKDLSSAEMMNVRAHLHSIPYLYSEELGDSDYNAETFIPLHSLMEGRLSRISL